MKKRTLLAAAALLAVITTAAYAAVSYDPDTGGFAGKGDVKDALGLSEAQIRAQAESLTFTYVDEATYDVPCKKDTGSQILTNTFKRERSVDAEVEHEARKNSQGVLTGFKLAPAGEETGGSDPVVCPGGWESDGDPVLVSGGPGSLYVNGVALPNTP